MTAQSVTPVLEAASRDIHGKHVKQLRREGQIPAVVYGHKQKNVDLTLDLKTFEKLYNEAGSTTLLELKVDGKKHSKVLIHDVQIDPTRHHITHADLYQVNLKEKITTEVPLELVGVADAVDIEGGILLTVKDYVEIECLPDNLVQHIEVDISTLKTFEDTITVADLKIPEGIEVLDDAEQVLISVTEPRSEEELAELDAPVATAETTFETEDGTKTEEAAEDSKE